MDMAQKFFKIFRAGNYPQGNISEADVQEMASTYDPSLHEAPLTVNHDDKSPSYATVDAVKAVGKELYASFKDVLAEAIDINKKFRKPSIEIAEYDGRKYLRAVSLTNFPQVKGLDTIAFSEKKNSVFFTEGLTLDLNKGVTMFSEQITKLAETLSINLSNYSVEGDIIAAATAAVQNLQTKLTDTSAQVSSLSLNLAKFSEAEITPESFAETLAAKNALEKKVLSFEEEMKRLTAKRVDDLVSFAVQSKDVTPAQGEGLRKFAEANYDEAKKFVDGLPSKKENPPLHSAKPDDKEYAYEEIIKDPSLAAKFSETELAEMKKRSKIFG
jgi:hypothetical protein